jgi:hypothetical protein
MILQLKPVHKELMLAKNERLLEAQGLIERRQAEFRSALQLVALDLGADLTKNWVLSQDFTKIEYTEPKGPEGPVDAQPSQ